MYVCVPTFAISTITLGELTPDLVHVPQQPDSTEKRLARDRMQTHARPPLFAPCTITCRQISSPVHWDFTVMPVHREDSEKRRKNTAFTEFSA